MTRQGAIPSSRAHSGRIRRLTPEFSPVSPFPLHERGDDRRKVTDEIPMRFYLPRPLWFALAMAVLVVAAVGLRFGVPAYRQREAIREIERLGGLVGTEGVPRWLG